VESWTKAIQLQPSMFRAYNNRAAAYTRMSKFPDAVSDYENAIRIAPGFATAFDNYAWLLATCEDPNIRDPEKAVRMARTACELNSFSDWSTLSTLAAACAEAGRVSEAADYARRALEDAPVTERSDLENLIRVYESKSGVKPPASSASRPQNTPLR
ncbi:MAG: tetratricopeptide repeat protein, partial [Planctomyces sp.]